MTIQEIREAAPDRLAHHIKARRLALRLSMRAAAATAGVARATWMTAELGARRISDTNYAGIEAALRWAPGSVERILAGRGDPEPLESAAEETSIDHTLGSRILAEMGGHARVVEILATEMAGESVAVAHVKHGAAVTVEIRLRYASRWQPLKIGDAVEYECRLVSEPLPSGGRERTPCRCGEPGRLHG